MIYWELFVGFLKVGLFAFGGGYAAVPLIRDVVLQYGWMDENMLTYMVAVSESTPGPIMVNLATYTGYTQAGIAGAALATMTVVLPAFLIILFAVAVMNRMFEQPVVKAVLRGLVPCIIGIIFATGCHTLLNQCVSEGPRGNLRAIALTVILGGMYFGSRKVMKRGISPIGLIGLSAVGGLLLL